MDFASERFDEEKHFYWVEKITTWIFQLQHLNVSDIQIKARQSSCFYQRAQQSKQTKQNLDSLNISSICLKHFAICLRIVECMCEKQLIDFVRVHKLKHSMNTSFSFVSHW